MKRNLKDLIPIMTGNLVLKKVHKFVIGGVGIMTASETEAIDKYKKLKQGNI